MSRYAISVFLERTNTTGNGFVNTIVMLVDLGNLEQGFRLGRSSLENVAEKLFGLGKTPSLPLEGAQLAHRFDRLGRFIQDVLKMLAGLLQAARVSPGRGEVNPVLAMGGGQVNCFL